MEVTRGRPNRSRGEQANMALTAIWPAHPANLVQQFCRGVAPRCRGRKRPGQSLGRPADHAGENTGTKVVRQLGGCGGGEAVSVGEVMVSGLRSGSLATAVGSGDTSAGSLPLSLSAVMLGQVQPTQYDLKFTLLGVPTIISPWFWAGAVFFGWSWLSVEPGGPANLLTWVLCMLFSLLLHEFGHALTMRAFGHQPIVVLYHLGGFARSDRRDTAGHSFLISAAGPAIQLLFFAILFVVAMSLAGPGAWNTLRTLPREGWPTFYTLPVNLLTFFGEISYGRPAFAALFSLLSINFLWPLLNLLPVWPLDGGQMLSAGLGMRRYGQPMDLTLKVGMLVGGIAAALFFVNGRTFAGIFFAMLAIQNYQQLQRTTQRPW